MKFIKQFLKLEASNGILFGIAAILAILFKNTALQSYYDVLIHFHLSFSILKSQIQQIINCVG